MRCRLDARPRLSELAEMMGAQAARSFLACDAGA